MVVQEPLFELPDRMETRAWWQKFQDAELCIGPPKNKLRSPDVIHLNDWFTLVVCDPVFQWEMFTKELTIGTILLLYANPALACRDWTGPPRIVAVQPDEWVSGWIVDVYNHIHGNPDV